MNVRGFRIVAVALGCLVPGLQGYAVAFPVDGNQTTLPVTTELNEDALSKPREVLKRPDWLSQVDSLSIN